MRTKGHIAVIAAGLALLTLGSLAPPAGAYVFDGPKWRRGRIPYYYDSSNGNAQAVRKAITAWNDSGARLRFVPVSRSQARVIIRHVRDQPCGSGFATIGEVAFGAPGYVVLPFSRPSQFGCDPFVMQRITVHELGHVVGLNHEFDVCAAMQNGLGFAPENCAQPPERWMWRCRLLEPDDVRGAVRAYGGSVKPVRTPANCAMYPAIGAPGAPQVVSVEPPANDFMPGTATISFVRPQPARIPAVLRTMLGVGQETFDVTVNEANCSDPAAPGTSDRWSVAPGAPQQLRLSLDPGAYCLKISAIDGVGREGASATLAVEVPGPPPPPPPTNDAFAAATSVDGYLDGYVDGAGSATLESGEPQPSCATARRTVWYRYTPAADEILEVSVWPDGTSAAAAIYEGSSLADLQEVACAAEDAASAYTTAPVTAGNTYWIQVTQQTSSGSFYLSIYPSQV